MVGGGELQWGTGTYLGPWGSRKTWLAWCPIISLRTEQWRLQPSDLDTLARPSGGQLATLLYPPAHLSTPGTSTGQLLPPLLALCPLLPAAQGQLRTRFSRCVLKKWAGR